MSQGVPKPQQAVSGFSVSRPPGRAALCLVVVASGLGSQIGTSKPGMGGGRLQDALCLTPGGPGRAPAVAGPGLHWVPSREALGLARPVASFGPSQSSPGF